MQTLYIIIRKTNYVLLTLLHYTAIYTSLECGQKQHKKGKGMFLITLTVI